MPRLMPAAERRADRGRRPAAGGRSWRRPLSTICGPTAPGSAPRVILLLRAIALQTPTTFPPELLVTIDIPTLEVMDVAPAVTAPALQAEMDGGRMRKTGQSPAGGSMPRISPRTKRLIAVETPLGKDHFLLTGISGHEAVSQLFRVRSRNARWRRHGRRQEAGRRERHLLDQAARRRAVVLQWLH